MLPPCALEVEGAILEFDDHAAKGSIDAQVGMLIVSDFQCPFCSRFAEETLPELEERYVQIGRVRIGCRHFPMARIHPKAMRGAEAAECAGQSGLFWEMHDLLFASPNAWDDARLKQYAETLGIEPGEFAGCLDTPPTKRIESQQAEAVALGIGSTPSFLFGVFRSDGRLEVKHGFSGARPVADFVRVLDGILVDAATGRRRADRPGRGLPMRVAFREPVGSRSLSG